MTLNGVMVYSLCVYCGQTAGRIKMPLGMEVGIGPGDIVLDRNKKTKKCATFFGGRLLGGRPPLLRRWENQHMLPIVCACCLCPWLVPPPACLR